MDTLTELMDGTYLERVSDRVCRLTALSLGLLFLFAAAGGLTFSLRLNRQLAPPRVPSRVVGVSPPTPLVPAALAWGHVFAPIFWAALGWLVSVPLLVLLVLLSAGFGFLAWAIGLSVMAVSALLGTLALLPLSRLVNWLNALHSTTTGGGGAAGGVALASLARWALGYGILAGVVAVGGFCATALCPPLYKPYRVPFRATLIALGLCVLFDNLHRKAEDPQDEWSLVVAPYVAALAADVLVLQLMGVCGAAARKYDDSGGDCCAAVWAGLLPSAARSFCAISHAVFVLQCARFADGKISDPASVTAWNWPPVLVLAAHGLLLLYFAAMPTDPLFRHVDSLRTAHLKLTGYFLPDIE